VSTLSASQPARRVTYSKLAFGLNAGLALASAALWLGIASRGDFWRADFAAFYTGWTIVRDGHGDRLYDFDLQSEYQGRLVPGRQGELLPYVYPPHFSLLAPLALLPLPAAFYVWTAFQVGLLFVVVRWLAEAAGRWGRDAPALATATLLAFQPVFLTFQLGQQALISLVALYGLSRALRDGKPMAAGAWLALAAVKPQLALLPVAFLLGGGYWRVLVYAAAVFVACSAAATAVLGWHCWTSFAELTRFHAGQFGTYGVYPLRGHNFKMLFTAVLGAEHISLVNALTGGALVASLALALALGWLARKADRSRWQLYFALAVLLAVLSAPHLNPHDALLLVVPAALTYDALLSVDVRSGRAFACLMIVCPLLFLADSYAMDWWPSQIRPFFFVEMGMAIWIVHGLTRSGRADHSRRQFAPT
jgi:hypothetical protein